MAEPTPKPRNNYNINVERLGEIITELAHDVQGSCEEASVCVGKTRSGNKIVVMVGNAQSDAARRRALPKFNCVNPK